MTDKDISINIWDKGRADCYSTPPDHDTHGSKKWSPGYAFIPFATIPLAIPLFWILRIIVCGLGTVTIIVCLLFGENLPKSHYMALGHKGITVIMNIQTNAWIVATIYFCKTPTNVPKYTGNLQQLPTTTHHTRVHSNCTCNSKQHASSTSTCSISFI